MKIVIAGLGKSGTTGLFFKIKNSIKKEAICFFEPDQYIPPVEKHNETILAKILIDNPERKDFESFREFDKKIFIIRDPRDRLISNILYEPWNSFYGDDKKVTRFLKLLELKEAKPRRVSVLDLLKLVAKLKEHNFIRNPKIGKALAKRAEVHSWLSNLYGRNFTEGASFPRHHPGYFTVTYEDFINGDMGALENYLGFKLSGNSKVNDDLTRVIRQKASGNWKDWFLPADIKFFKRRFDEVLKSYGYETRWEISRNPSLSPQFSSHYVKNLVEKRRKKDI